MKQYAVIGIGAFGRRILDELSKLDVEVLIVDKDPEIIDRFKDRATTAFAVDVTNEDVFGRVVPATINAAIIDLGGKVEASILVTSYCRKLGIRNIVAKAQTEEHGEVLEIVGATRVVFPEKEAAKRLTPLLTSSYLLNYLPISTGLVIAEVGIPDSLVGKTSIEANLRKEYSINVVAVKPWPSEEYRYFSPDHRFGPDDVALVAGSEELISAFTGGSFKLSRRNGTHKVFSNFFPKRRVAGK
jgi:trk system potassium uptake protein